MDNVFLWTVFVFLLIGFFILASASMGLLARTAGADFSSIIFQQIIYGLVGCIGLYLFAFKFDYLSGRRSWPIILWKVAVRFGNSSFICFFIWTVMAIYF